MRQVGILAAAGLIALEKSPARLHEDHANAKRLARASRKFPACKSIPPVSKPTSSIFDCTASGMNAVELCDALHARGIWAQDTALNSVRMVTHWNVSRGALKKP